MKHLSQEIIKKSTFPKKKSTRQLQQNKTKQYNKVGEGTKGIRLPWIFFLDPSCVVFRFMFA